MASSPGKPFSKRYGYSGQAREITIREDAPENLRSFVLKTAIELGLTPDDLRDEACAVLHKRPNPNNWSGTYVLEEVQRLIDGCVWYRVYDFIERLHRRFGKAAPSLLDRENPAAEFQERLNEFFAEEGIGWQLQDGEIVARGSEAFESAVAQADTALKEAGRETARREIHKALSDLSQRPDPDLTGAVQHAMAALECVARDVCGDSKATLGEILKQNPDLVPKPLDIAVEKVWGYASEKGRHLREGCEPKRKEVELVVGLAATVATYLSR